MHRLEEDAGVFCPSEVLRQGLSLDTQLTILARLTDWHSQGLSVSVPSSLGLLQRGWDCCPYLDNAVEVGDFPAPHQKARARPATSVHARGSSTIKMGDVSGLG